MWRALAVLLGVAATACGGEVSAGPHDAGQERTGLIDPDVTVPPPDAGPRLLPHEGETLADVTLGVVYVGDLNAGGPPDMTATATWLVGSAYWGLLSEYGIHTGAVSGSARVPTTSFFQGGDVGANGLVDILIMQSRVAEAIQGADGGAPLVSIPGAEAFVFLLPDGINIALGTRGTYTYQTCIDTDGYHAYDGVEGYVVLPPCPAGRSPYAMSHEIAELVTDPEPYHGWASDTDVPINGGEVADLCAQQVLEEGITVTRFWSNAANGCVP